MGLVYRMVGYADTRVPGRDLGGTFQDKGRVTKNVVGCEAACALQS